MKRATSCILALASGLALAACGGTSPPTAASPSVAGGVQGLYEAAKKEGAVTWQAGVLDQAAEPIGKAFMARYPGIQVTFNPINEPQVPAQVITEATSGAKVVKSLDLAHGGPTQFKPLLERDLLAAGSWAELGVEASRIKVDGKWIANEDSVNVWVYNTTLVQPTDVPKQWDDLLKPRWKGKKIVTNASAAGLSQLFFTMGEDKARDFLTALKAQDLVVVKSKGPSREMVANGQAHLGISTVKDVIEMKKKGAPVEMASLGPMERDLRGWYLPKGVQHPNAATLFMSWIVSPEGWAQQQKAGLDVATPCSASEVAKLICERDLKYLDFETAGLEMFAYYNKLAGYESLAQQVLELKPQ